LLLRQMTLEVSLNHVWMTTTSGRVRRRTAQDFGEKFRDVLRMLGAHLRKYRSENLVRADSLVEARSQTGERGESAKPFVQSGHV